MASEIAASDRILTAFQETLSCSFSHIENGVVYVRQGSEVVDLDKVNEVFIKAIEEIGCNLNESEKSSAQTVVGHLITLYQTAMEVETGVFAFVMRCFPGLGRAFYRQMPLLQNIQALGANVKKTA